MAMRDFRMQVEMYAALAAKMDLAQLSVASKGSSMGIMYTLGHGL